MVQALCRRNGTSPYSRSGSTKAELAAYRSPAHFIEGCAANHILPPLRIDGMQRYARTPNSRCVSSLKPAVSRIVRLASRRPARDFGIGARPTVFQVHTMVRLAADVASWQTKMSSAAAMVSLPSAAYPLALPSAMAGIASPRIPSPGIRKATSQSAACRLTAGLSEATQRLFEFARSKIIMRLIPESGVKRTAKNCQQSGALVPFPRLGGLRGRGDR